MRPGGKPQRGAGKSAKTELPALCELRVLRRNVKKYLPFCHRGEYTSNKQDSVFPRQCAQNEKAAEIKEFLPQRNPEEGF